MFTVLLFGVGNFGAVSCVESFELRVLEFGAEFRILGCGSGCRASICWVRVQNFGLPA